jgi:choline dehydrogenase-like flavoprotein
MTIASAHEVAGGTTLRADVCIAGAGAAGITIALRLRDSGRSVLLLESGGFERDHQTDDLARGSMSGIQAFTLDQHRARVLGGSTSLWSGWCTPFTPEDFEPRAWIPHSGWPIRYAHLVPYYRRAQRLVQLGAFEYDPVVLSQQAGQSLLTTPSGRLLTSLFQFSPPTHFGVVHRSQLDQAPDVRVLLHANVVDIVLDDGAGRVARCEVAALSGPRFAVEAGAFVLATGGLENARLLLATDIGNANDLVGRFFMEHPQYYWSVVWVRSPDAIDESFYRLHRQDVRDVDGSRRTIEMRGAFTLARNVLARERLPDFSATLEDVPFEAVGTGAIRAIAVRALLPRSAGHVMQRLEIRAEQTPDPGSRVTLSAARDALGMRRADLRWQIRREDLLAYKRALTILAAELGQLGGRVWAPSDGEGRFAGQVLGGGHHIGTTRMAASPADGVVDADCRVFGVANLYIAGSSVFTTASRANPTLTIVALAERLADHLAGLPYEREEAMP